MESLRKPFFLIAVALAAIVVLVELGKVGADAILPKQPSTIQCASLDDPDLRAECLQPGRLAQLQELSKKRPPGLGVPYLALIDGVVLFTMVLMAASLFVPERVVGRTQGCATLIFSVLLLLGSIVLIFVALGLLILMVSLFLAAPFGTLTYLAIYGFFDRSGASIILSLLMILKLALSGSLLLAHQKFIQNKGLVLLMLTALLGNVIVSFLHGFVPGILVSITDAIAAIVVAILAVIWAIILLIGAVVSIIKIIRPD
jgi:hypothetical protein